MDHVLGWTDKGGPSILVKFELRNAITKKVENLFTNSVLGDVMYSL